MTMNYYSFGACREVTGSKHFLEIEDCTIQMDSGMFQGRRREAYKKNSDLPFNPAGVSAILLSHAHFDHSGALPIMRKGGFSGPVFATPATRDIAEIILLDSAHIQEKDYEYLREKREKHPDRDITLYPPLYSTEDVMATMPLFTPVPYHKQFEPCGGVTAEFLDAGHILGSSVVLLTVGGDTRIAFSGDLGRKHHPIIKDPEIPPDLDYLILEGTYGDRLHGPIQKAEEKLQRIIHRTHRRGGKIIIPAFTIERTQELIYTLHLLLLNDKIPNLPIYVDSPMAVNATTIFKKHPQCFDEDTYRHFLDQSIDPFGFDTIHYIRSTEESKRLNSLKGSAIIISASGMAENGRILHHLRNNIEDPSTTVLIVGYMAEDTLGRKLVEKYHEVKIFGRRIPVRAEVQTLNLFSSHADYNDIVKWVKELDLKRLRKIFLVHGEAKALGSLRGKLLDAGVKAVDITRSGQRYRLRS